MRKTHTHHGFSLVEILIVIGIIGALMALILGAILPAITHSGKQMAVVNLQSMAMAMSQYGMDWQEFPPMAPPPGLPAQDTTPRAGSEQLFYYLCTQHRLGERTLGGYLPANPSNSVSGPGVTPALISPLKGFYSFGFEGNKETNRRVQCWLIDPGPDRLLGGTVNEESAFTPDNSDANGDGKADHLDNIIEKIALR